MSDSCLVDKKRESLLRDAEVPGNDTTCQKWWKPETVSETAASRDHPGRNSSQYDTVFVREHEHVHHGHSHAHSHLHSAPDSISSVGESCSIHLNYGHLAVSDAFVSTKVPKFVPLKAAVWLKNLIAATKVLSEWRPDF